VSPGGVTFGVPYREAGGAPDATVSVLQELDPARSWVATRSIWYRWDDTRIGECLAVEQFRRRFIRAG
jgi:hypothetical protein